MKKLIALLLALVMVAGLVACGGGEATPTTTEAPVENVDPTDAPEQEDPTDAPVASDITYAIVAKSEGNPYMEKMVDGFKEACAAMGVGCEVKYPATATKIEDQIAVINELIGQNVKGIAIAANDAEALSATLEEAKAEGITIITLDSDTTGSQMFINQAGIKEVAQVLVDSVYDMAGGEGEFAVLSAASTATNQNAWIAAMEEIIDADEKYANLNWVETVYGDDESQKSTDETQNLMNKYPNLKVICCPTTVGVLACAKAVQDSGSAIKVAGLGLPSEMKDYVADDKVCPYMYLWNPIDVGSCAAYAIKAIADGKVGEVGTEFTADNGTTYTIMEGDNAELQIIVGPPFAFNGENIAEWAAIY
ncbi:MAG: substrate-binding domain-containing protein [Oscillospiraceae bacterium]|nr:substrate-binding domain-containing protein [Oscillospiraceae bacterium]